MVYAEDRERLDLLLYLISKTNNIETYSKFQSILYLLKKEIDNEIFENYKFDSNFLTLKDNTLECDLEKLQLQRYIDTSEVPVGLAHTHRLSINNHGKLRLKVFDIHKNLNDRFGQNMKKMVELTIKYNDMPYKELRSLINTK